MATINGVHYPEGGDDYNLPADFLHHAQTDAQQAIDEAAQAEASAKVYTDALVDAARFNRIPLSPSDNLTDLTKSGSYLYVGTFSPDQGYPTEGSGTVNVIVTNQGANRVLLALVMTSASTRLWTRRFSAIWHPWRRDNFTHGAPVTTAAQLDALHTADSSGIYTVAAGTRVDLGLPAGSSGWVEVIYIHTGATSQRFTSTSNEVLTRYRNSTTWSDWSAPHGGVIPTGSDLNDYTERGDYSTRWANPVDNHPSSGSQSNFALEVFPIGFGNVLQRMTSDNPWDIAIFERVRNGSTWYDWTRINGKGTGGLPATYMERTGSWTSRESGYEYLAELSKHRYCNVQEIGRSFNDWPIHAAIFGDPSLPAVLVVASQHGNEPGPREGAMMWARQLTQSTTIMQAEMCIVVVPMVNPDRILVSRGNGNGDDTNRDWVTRQTPEVQAVTSLLTQFDVVAAVDIHNGGYPREVSLKLPLDAPVGVTDMSQLLYDAVQAGLEAEGHLVRNYDPDAVGMFQSGVAVVDNIPAILVEVPGGTFPGGSGSWYPKDPHYQGHTTARSADILAHYVWNNLQTFVDYKNA